MTFEFGQVSLLETWSIADDEGAFAFMNILKLGKAANAFAPPGMKICGRKLRDTAECIICIARKLKYGSWEGRLKSLFHDFKR